jgi:hypothetical protein
MTNSSISWSTIILSSVLSLIGSLLVAFFAYKSKVRRDEMVYFREKLEKLFIASNRMNQVIASQVFESTYSPFYNEDEVKIYKESLRKKMLEFSESSAEINLIISMYFPSLKAAQADLWRYVEGITEVAARVHVLLFLEKMDKYNAKVVSLFEDLHRIHNEMQEPFMSFLDNIAYLAKKLGKEHDELTRLKIVGRKLIDFIF